MEAAEHVRSESRAAQVSRVLARRAPTVRGEATRSTTKARLGSFNRVLDGTADGDGGGGQLAAEALAYCWATAEAGAEHVGSESRAAHVN